MPQLTLDRLQSYRDFTFRLPARMRLKTKEEAIDYVNERGFIYFWPIKEVVLPSLWVAVAGDRPVADAHDDPGHVTWGWKDALLGARCWYYAKVLRKRATLISLRAAPYFYALSENFGSPDEDYLTLYEQGRLTQESRLIYEALLVEGPLDTIALRRATHLSSPESEHRFSRALVELQADFKVLPVGVTQAGGWRYAFAYDLVHRHFPEIVEQAHPIKQSAARQELVELYFRSVGAARLADLVKLFGWPATLAEKALLGLSEAGRLQRAVSVPGQTGEWFALADLLE